MLFVFVSRLLPVIVATAAAAQAQRPTLYYSCFVRDDNKPPREHSRSGNNVEHRCKGPRFTTASSAYPSGEINP